MTCDTDELNKHISKLEGFSAVKISYFILVTFVTS